MDFGRVVTNHLRRMGTDAASDVSGRTVSTIVASLDGAVLDVVIGSGTDT